MIHPYYIIVCAANYDTRTRCLTLLQKRAIKVIGRDTHLAHTKQRFRELNIIKFECINVCLTGIFVYKVINKLLLEIFLSYFLKITDKHKYSTRATSGQGLIVKFARTNYRKFALTIYIRRPKVWNDIPISIRQVDYRAYASLKGTGGGT